LLHEHECTLDENLGLELVFQLIPAPLAHQTWLQWRLSYFSYGYFAYFITLLIPQVQSNLKPHKIFKPKTTRSGFKIPDWVQGQGVSPIAKAQHTWVCEHLPEVCNAAIGPKMGF
jgi:hypothetical protein